MSGNAPSLPAIIFLSLSLSLSTFAQSQTTGGITGTVKDQAGAVIVAAEITVRSSATRQERKTKTDRDGYFAVPLLPPGLYQLTVGSNGFQKIVFDNIVVAITEATQIDAQLIVGQGPEAAITIHAAPPMTQTDGPGLGRVVDSRGISELPLATRNYTQALALSPGADVGLADNSGVGRNSQNISVNGARRTQNNFRINGVDSNTIGTNSALFIAVPAPETIQEFKVQDLAIRLHVWSLRGRQCSSGHEKRNQRVPRRGLSILSRTGVECQQSVPKSSWSAAPAARA